NLELCLGWLQILPEGHDVAIDFTQIAKRFHNFVVGFAKPEHYRRFGISSRIMLFHERQNTKRLRISSPWIAYSFLQSLHCFNVVSKNIWAGIDNLCNVFFT